MDGPSVLQKNKRVYFLMDSRDSSSVLRLAVSSRKPKIVVENALVAAVSELFPVNTVCAD